MERALENAFGVTKPTEDIQAAGRTGSFSVAVRGGLLGVVVLVGAGSSPPSSSVSNVTSCALEDWFEITSTIGPAPNRCGDTLTLEFVMAAVTLIGAGGRGSFL